jgi:hypothetical protein
MLRTIVFAVALVFLGTMVVLTIDDFISNGVTGLGVIAVCVLFVFGVGIVGALLHPPRE